MATRQQKENDATLPFAALQLLAPPVRLVSAALWKVLKQRDVMQYGIVEEFVTSACETVPGLLTLRHQGKLALGLRARLILELCRKNTDVDVIAPHLERIRAPAPLSSSSASVKKDVKIQRTVESFHSFVQTLLTNQAEKEHFFKEQFPIDYGPKFDQELEKLLWEFLIRLDQLLPVPNLAQTVSWLSEAPPVLEECAQAATQPQLLKLLLQHQACLGHLESAASLPPNMGDSILASLSLPPSGKVPSNHPAGLSWSAAERTNGSKPGATAPFITPVIGLISNDNVPAMVSARKKTLQGEEESNSRRATNDQPDPSTKFTLVKRKPKPAGVDLSQERLGEERSLLNQSGGMKRKQPESDSEEEAISENTAGEKSINRNQRIIETDEEESQTLRNKGCNRELLNSYINKLGIERLHLPEDPSLCSVFASCLSSNPRVVIQKLSVSSSSTSWSGGGGKRKSSTWKQTGGCQTLESPGLDNKENRPVLASGSSSSSQQRTHGEMVALSEDYVADSEDEASKNFKGRLFMKRYYKTKHGTYVPTLREFWRPRMTRRDLLSPASRRR